MGAVDAKSFHLKEGLMGVRIEEGSAGYLIK
jgi:hypothetical protein